MPRIVGVDIPANKQIWVSLQYIYGIGKYTALEILKKANIAENIKAKDLTDEQISRISKIIEEDYVVEGALRRQISQNIQRLKDIKCYRGIRHIKGLPVRGQRTCSNARTRKGPRKTVAGKKKAKASK